MNALGRNLVAALLTRRIESVGPGEAWLEDEAGPRRAAIAASCLMQPEPGDEVLVAELSEPWVIAILRRANTSPACLSAPDGLGIEAGRALTLTARSLEIRAGTATLWLDDLRHIGRSLTAHVAILRTFCANLETLAERVLLKTGHSHRLVDGLDQTKAGEIHQHAAGTLHQQAENAFLAANDVTRITAGQIHMG